MFWFDNQLVMDFHYLRINLSINSYLKLCMNMKFRNFGSKVMELYFDYLRVKLNYVFDEILDLGSLPYGYAYCPYNQGCSQFDLGQLLVKTKIKPNIIIFLNN